MLGRTRHVHFVGIGGIGMSGIAELLANLGYKVSGSDVVASGVTDRLRRLGVCVEIGHEAAHVGDADVVVVSSAVRAANPEIAEAKRRKIPVISRAEMLAELMRLRYGIAVAGAHGKTSTTSMIAVVLERAGLDPTAVIGGRLSAFGSNARLGRGDYMVAEADESDRSFLKLSPTLAVITSIDHEHLDTYGSFHNLMQAFADFADKVPFYGAVVACADDLHVRDLLPRLYRRVITYGIAPSGADIVADNVVLQAFGATCHVRQLTGHKASCEDLGVVRLNVPGRHNVHNALAAVAVGLELGVGFATIAAALEEFRGVERRFELRGEAGGVMVVDDYGHHPTEVAAVLAAARAGMNRRVIVAFQPHRYTRTIRLLDEFGTALADADEIVLTDVYGAGEEPIAGATAAAIAARTRARTTAPVHLVRNLDEVPSFLARIARPGDLVLTLGAGSIGTVADRVLVEIAKRCETPV